MGLMTKEDILGQDDLETKELNLDKFWPPKEGEESNIVRIRMMPGSGRDHFEEQVAKRTRKGDDGKIIVTGTKGFKVTLCALCIVDEDNNLLFSEDDVQDLNEKKSEAIDFIFSECQELNGMSDDDVKDLVANFEIDLSDESGSNSQQDLAVQ